MTTQSNRLRRLNSKLLIFSFIIGMGVLNASFGTIMVHGSTTMVQSHKSGNVKPTPEKIWRGIKTAALAEVLSNSPLLTAPEFKITQVGSIRQLTIVKGDVAELGFQSDPYELPFKKQILVEALRRSLSPVDLSARKSGRGRSHTVTVWQPVLATAEALIKKTVVEIESERDKSRLQARLREMEAQIDDILYDKLYDVVEQLAIRNEYNVIYGRGGGDIKKFSVNVTTSPAGARVLMMPLLIYHKQVLMKTDRSSWPWVEIVQNPYELLGRYRYLTISPDGKQVEGTIDVRNGNPILLPARGLR